MGCIRPEPPEDAEGFLPTQCGSHSSALADNTTLPSNGYAHETWMPYAQCWGKTKTSLGAGRGSSLFLFVFEFAIFWNETRSFATLFQKGVGILSLQFFLP